MAILTAGGMYLASRALMPKNPDWIRSAVHFRKGFREMQRGLEAIYLGEEEQSPEERAQERESKRIPIE
jgi:hypothetical protein